MKTRIQSLSLLATLAIALGMIAMGGTLHAQNSPSSSPDRQAQQPSQSPDTQSPPPQSQQPPSSQAPPDTQQGASNGTGETQVFSGTVVKAGDKYVLKDDSGHTYDIDHQDEVRKFEGKRVRVQGTLDAANNKIMVK